MFLRLAKWIDAIITSGDITTPRGSFGFVKSNIFGFLPYFDVFIHVCIALAFFVTVHYIEWKENSATMERISLVEHLQS